MRRDSADTVIERLKAPMEAAAVHATVFAQQSASRPARRLAGDGLVNQALQGVLEVVGGVDALG